MDEYDSLKKEWKPVPYYDSILREDFYYTYYFEPIEGDVMSFIIQTKDSALLIKYASTIEGPLGAAAASTELFAYKIVGVCCCDLDFLIKSLNAIKDKTEKSFLRDEIYYAINSYWSTLPVRYPVSYCPENLYKILDKDISDSSLEKFVNLKFDILKRIQHEVKD